MGHDTFIYNKILNHITPTILPFIIFSFFINIKFYFQDNYNILKNKLSCNY